MLAQIRARIERVESLVSSARALASGAFPSSSGLHPPVQVVATSNVAALTGLGILNGVLLTENARLYLANQTIGTTGGLWVAHAGAWTRPTDWHTGQLIAVGEQITVAQGSDFTRFGSSWIVTQGGVVDASTPLAFPAIDKGTGVLDLNLTDRWILNGAIATANDTTVGAVAALNVTAVTQGGANFGRGTGTLTLDGTAGHTVGFVIVNF